MSDDPGTRSTTVPRTTTPPPSEQRLQQRAPEQRPASATAHAIDRSLLARRTLAAAAALLLVSVLVLRTSEAAFTATTANEGNEFATATISLSSDVTVPLFGDEDALTYALDLYPGASVAACIDIAFEGPLGADDLTEVSVDIVGASGPLAAALAVDAELLPGDCTGGGGTGFASGSLAGFTPTDSGWTPAADGDARGYRFTVTAGEDVEMGQSLDGVAVVWSVSTDAS
jgi:hypothetical protein